MSKLFLAVTAGVVAFVPMQSKANPLALAFPPNPLVAVGTGATIGGGIVRGQAAFEWRKKSDEGNALIGKISDDPAQAPALRLPASSLPHLGHYPVVATT